MRLSIHTVFILRENILFIEEWINYHLSIGFDRFFLYDNSKCLTNEGSKPGCNKYNYNYAEITRHISDDQLANWIGDLRRQFADVITYINWEPKDKDGNIIYGQQRSIRDYITQFSNLSDWTAFIDMDEFIMSKIPLKKVISKCEAIGASDLCLLQKKFDDRFNNLDIPVTHIVDCIEGIDTSAWSPKHILKNNSFNLEEKEYWNVHCPPSTKDICALGDFNKLRINHYNINDVQLAWMKEFYRSDEDFHLNAKCFDLLQLAEETIQAKK